MRDAAGCPERWWLLPLGALAAGLSLSVPFWVSDLDVRVATAIRTWSGQDGALCHQWWWTLAHHLPSVLAVLIGSGALAAVVAGVLVPQRGSLRPGLFVLLSLVIGCGLVTNALLKDRTGRPRPRDTVHLGGAWEYRSPWDLGVPGRGRSFPCGHATVPAMGITLWLLWRRSRPRLARASLAAGGVLTAYVGAARMLAGAHWLSDVLWSLLVMTVVPAVLHRWLLPDSATPTAVTPLRQRRRRLAHAVATFAAAAGAAAALVASPFRGESASRRNLAVPGSPT